MGRNRIAVAAGLLVLVTTSVSMSQTLGTNDLYDVAVDATGEYVARTGRLHPVASRPMLYRGANLVPGTSWNAVRSYDSMTEWTLRRVPATAAPGFSCFGTDVAGLGAGAVTPLTGAGGRTTGVRVSWSVSSGTDDLLIQQEVEVTGSEFADSAVRVTLCITNRSPVPAHAGIRFLWDWQLASQDGPYMGLRPPVPPGEPFIGYEEDFASPAFTSYDLADDLNPSSAPSVYLMGGTVSGPSLPVAPTPPELVQYASWPGASGQCFEYATSRLPAGGSDSCTVYEWGATPATAIEIAPSGSWCATQYMFAFAVDPPPFCRIAATASGGTFCQGSSVVIDASASASADCSGPLEYRFTDPWGDVAQEWSPSATCPAAIAGTWVVSVRCAASPSCATSTTVQVAADRAPSLYGVTAADDTSCGTGVVVTWNAATWLDTRAGGFYDLHRSEISCADALLQPPLAAGVTPRVYLDATTQAGRTYYYALVAEDGTPAVACTPVGTRGGATATACAAAVTDAGNAAPPARVCWPLRVEHAGQQVTLRWSSARPLEAGEHVHVLKMRDDPTAAPFLACPETCLGTAWIETDTASPRQFFDVRYADACERESPDDEPPGRDPPAGIPCP